MRKLIVVVVLGSLIPALALAEEDRYEDFRKEEEKRLAGEKVRAKRKALSKEDQERVTKCEKLLEGDRFISRDDWLFIRDHGELFSKHTILRHCVAVGRKIKGVEDIMKEFAVEKKDEDMFLFTLTFGVDELVVTTVFDSLKRLARVGPGLLGDDDLVGADRFKKWILPWATKERKK